eukprot:c34707_g1_i1 orf=85-255(-)
MKTPALIPMLKNGGVIRPRGYLSLEMMLYMTSQHELTLTSLCTLFTQVMTLLIQLV